MPLTQLQTAYCGIELQNYSDVLLCNSISGFSQYEFEFTEVDPLTNLPVPGGIAGTHLRNWHNEQLTATNIPGIATTPNTKYAVRIRVQIGNY